jgi:hypothetical protein
MGSQSKYSSEFHAYLNQTIIYPKSIVIILKNQINIHPIIPYLFMDLCAEHQLLFLLNIYTLVL